MALYSNNVLLGALGGPQYTQDQQDPTRQQIDSIRDYAKTALGATLPTTMYNPLQGVGYLLDKLQGRNELDRANELQKSALAQALAGTAGQTAAPDNSNIATGSIDQSQGQVQPQAQPAAQVAPQPAAQPQAIAPQLKPSIAPSGGSVPAKLVIASPQGQESEVTPDQIAGGLPDGYKVVKAVDAQGNDIPVPAAQAPVQMPQAATAQQPPVAAPNQAAQAAPQASPITTGSNPQAAGQGSEGITIGPPPVRPNLSPAILKHILALDPEDQKAVMSQYEAANTPQLSDTGVGTYWQLPDGRKGFMPKTQISSMKAEGADIPIAISGGPNGITSKSLVPGGAPGSGASGAGGGIDDIINHFSNLKANNDAHAAALSAGATGVVKANQEGLSKIAGTLPEAQQLTRNVQQLKSIEATGALKNVATGPFSADTQNAKKVISNAFPDLVDQKSLAAADTYNKVSVLLAQGLAKQLTNRPTQYDFRTFLEKATPSFSTSPEARRSILNMYEMQSNEQLAKASIAQEVFQGGGSLADYNSKMNDWYDTHPLNFTYNGKEFEYKGKHLAPDDPSLLNSGGGNSQADPLEGKTATGPNNQQIVRKSGKWVPVEK